MKYEELKGN